MPRSRRRFAIWACVLGTAMLAIGIGVATGAKLKNGGFESGSFKGWKVSDRNEVAGGSWFVYSGTEIPSIGDDGPPLPLGGGGGFYAPPQGTYGAVTNQDGPGLHILHRMLKLKPDKKHKLKLRVYYRTGPELHSPPTFEFEGEENQQYRIDVLKKRAPIDSLKNKDILVEVFGTEPGDPSEQAPKKVSVNLSQFAGKKVRLRLAEVDNQGNFYAAVDAVKLKSKPKK
jgi:hypothetical protein